LKILQVRVKPNSRASSLETANDGSWVARVKAPPVDGKANRELVGLIARHFDVGKSRVLIRSGASGRLKRVVIDN
jgi:uncharacterized protein (TIGR00251 family)